MTKREILEEALKIFDKHFPSEKNTKKSEKIRIVKFFLRLHELGAK